MHLSSGKMRVGEKEGEKAREKRAKNCIDSSLVHDVGISLKNMSLTQRNDEAGSDVNDTGICLNIKYTSREMQYTLKAYKHQSNML